MMSTIKNTIWLWPSPYTTNTSRGYKSGHTGIDIFRTEYTEPRLLLLQTEQYVESLRGAKMKIVAGRL